MCDEAYAFMKALGEEIPEIADRIKKDIPEFSLMQDVLEAMPGAHQTLAQLAIYSPKVAATGMMGGLKTRTASLVGETVGDIGRKLQTFDKAMAGF